MAFNKSVMFMAMKDIEADDETKCVKALLYAKEARALNKELGIKNINYGKNTHKKI